MVILSMLLAAAPTATCELSTVTSSRASHEAFARRAVEVITLASTGETAGQGRLNQLVDSTATFVLGSGDVGSTLGKGVAGAFAMAKQMHADQFRFLGWDYMDGPADGCAKSDIEVEFVDISQAAVTKVKFSFENGRVVAAQGWRRSYQSGVLSTPITP